jgi:hypothetical protein
VRCQYCGEALRSLRRVSDQDFCSASHRELYHDRVRRVLGQLSKPELSSHHTVEPEELSPERIQADQAYAVSCRSSDPCDSPFGSTSWTSRSTGITVEADLLETEVEVGTLPASFPIIDLPFQALGQSRHSHPQIVSNMCAVAGQIPLAELSYGPKFELGLPILAPAVVVEVPAACNHAIELAHKIADCFSPMTLDLERPKFSASHSASLLSTAAPIKMGPLELQEPTGSGFYESRALSWLPIATKVIALSVPRQISEAQFRASGMSPIGDLRAESAPGEIRFSPITLYPVFRNSARIKGWRLRLTFAQRGTSR